MRKPYYLPLLLAVLVVGGCKKDSQSSDEREERDPLVKAGQAYMDQNQWKEAEQSFKQALENDPTMARPHLDLAMIYQSHTNYVYAIYHYDRYLELRPESEKADLIKEQRDKVQRALQIKSIQESPEFKKLVTNLQQLMQQNAALKKQLAMAKQQMSKPPEESVPTAVVKTQPKPTAPVSSRQPAPKPASSHQIYNVVAGDTLTKIATKFYGDPGKWDTIYEANKDTLASPSSLKVGQTLVIPTMGTK